MKYILPFLCVLGACTHLTPTPTAQTKTDTPHHTEPTAKSPLVRNGDTAILRTTINHRQIEVFTIKDSILRFSQEGEQTLTIPFDTELFAYNTSMDLNRDNQNDLYIYSPPNMHGQMIPFVFLSDQEGKLYYRPDIGICNLCYDTTTKQIVSFYIGGPFTKQSKDLYTWKNNTLQLVRGASLEPVQTENLSMIYKLEFYKGNNRKVYRTVTEDSEAIWDTTIFKKYPVMEIFD